METCQYLDITKHLGVFDLMKLLCQKYTDQFKEEDIKFQKRLFILGYQVLLEKNYTLLDLDGLELIALLMTSTESVRDETFNINTEQELKRLLVKLESLSYNITWNPFDVLKILFLLHSNHIAKEKCSKEINCGNTVKMIDKSVFPRFVTIVDSVSNFWSTSPKNECSYFRCENIRKGKNKKESRKLKTKKTGPLLKIRDYALDESEIIKFDWEAVKIDYEGRKTWETYGMPSSAKPEPYISTIDLDMKMLSMLVTSSAEDSGVYVTMENLRTHIISALLGTPSPSFIKKDNRIVLARGVFTDGVRHDTLNKLMESVVHSGSCFLELQELQKKYSMSACSMAFFLSLNHFLDLYTIIALDFPKVLLITAWLKYIAPVAHQIQFLSSCLMPMPVAPQLLDKFYNFIFQDFSCPYLSLMIQAFLYDCCLTYFNLLDNWIFEGIWHKDLFIKINCDLNNISSKEDWLDAFTLNEKDAPKFLPFQEIFTCGRNVALLKLCSKKGTFMHTVLSECGRPRIKLCSNFTELTKVNVECVEYSAFVKSFYANIDNNKWNDKEDYPSETHQKVLLHSVNKLLLENKRSLVNGSINETLVHNQDSESGGETLIKNKSLIVHREEAKHTGSSFSLFEDVKSSSETNKLREELCHRYEYLIAGIEKRRLHLLWQNARNEQIPNRTKFLHQLYSSDCEEEFHFLPDTPTAFCPNEPFNSNVIIDSVITENLPDTSDAVNEQILSDSSVTNYTMCESGISEEFLENSYNSGQVVQELNSENDFVTGNDPSNSCDSRLSAMSPSFNDIPSSPFDHSIDITPPTKPSDDTGKVIEEGSLSVDGNSKNNEELLNPQKMDVFRFDSQFIKNIIGDHFELNGISNNTEKCVDDVVTFREMIVDSVIIPLRMQQNLVNDALLRVFIVENKFLWIARALTNRFFLMDGLFSSRLIDCLCNAIETEKPNEFLTCNRLTRILDEATFYTDPNVSFKINYIPQYFECYDPKMFACISLTYKIEWPLNLLITPVMITKCDTVFAFLVTLEKTFWNLKHLFVNFKLDSSIITEANQSHAKQLHLHRFIMMQFISSLRSYIQNVVVDENWNKFVKDIQNVENLESLYRTHVDYIKKVRFMCFLGKSSAKLLQEIMELQRTILIYCKISRMQLNLHEVTSISRKVYKRQCYHFNLFVSLARYVTAYVEKLVERRYQVELDGLLQILTVNSFYLPKSWPSKSCDELKTEDKLT